MSSYHHHASHETQYPAGGPLPYPAPPGFPSSPLSGYQGYLHEGPPPPPPHPTQIYPPYRHYHDGSGCLSFLRACLAGLCCCCVLEECCF